MMLDDPNAMRRLLKALNEEANRWARIEGDYEPGRRVVEFADGGGSIELAFRAGQTLSITVERVR